MAYLENPKTRGSGILACIPQTGRCPNGCKDCFFQSGRSFLEPLEKHLPNVPGAAMAEGRIVRVNDGNDSNVRREVVIEATKAFAWKFFNTAIPRDLDTFPGPVVLTVNPGEQTDGLPVLLQNIPRNLMFVRVRTNTWNLASTVDPAVQHYTAQSVPVVLTFMAYFEQSADIPVTHRANYRQRERTLNTYWAITQNAWARVMGRYRDNALVHSCGREGISGGSACKNCGNCLREFFTTRERMRTAE